MVSTTNGEKEEHQFGWAISDKIVPEVNKQESAPSLSTRYASTRP